ncbi:MAG TPA: hypothetical protein VEL51_17875, partial [Vicinamibacterales bacterium]|nr:hypothetical protein [Vicinamibacterales bacterium]
MRENDVLARPFAVCCPFPFNDENGKTGPEDHFNNTSRSGSGTGSLWSIIASARLNTAALAPMPIASDITAIV